MLQLSQAQRPEAASTMSCHGMACCIMSRHGKLRCRFVTVWRPLSSAANQLFVAEIKVLRAGEGRGRCRCQVQVSSTGGAFYAGHSSMSLGHMGGALSAGHASYPNPVHACVLCIMHLHHMCGMRHAFAFMHHLGSACVQLPAHHAWPAAPPYSLHQQVIQERLLLHQRAI